MRGEIRKVPCFRGETANAKWVIFGKTEQAVRERAESLGQSIIGIRSYAVDTGSYTGRCLEGGDKAAHVLSELP